MRSSPQRTENYSEATQHLETTAAKVEALADAATHMFGEQNRRWNDLMWVLDDQVKPSLERLSGTAEKHAADLSSLSQAVADAKSSLVKIEDISGQQAASLRQQSETLGRQQAALLEVGRWGRNSTYAAAAAALLSLVTLVMVVIHLAA